MTYQEYFKRLHERYTEASSKFLAKDREMSRLDGFGDMKDLAEYATLKRHWQLTSNDYWGFLGTLKGKDINPNDQLFS